MSLLDEMINETASEIEESYKNNIKPQAHNVLEGDKLLKHLAMGVGDSSDDSIDTNSGKVPIQMTNFQIIGTLLKELDIKFSSSRHLSGKYPNCNCIEIRTDKYNYKLIFKPTDDRLLFFEKEEIKTDNYKVGYNYIRPKYF